eukprot:3570779-Rhodomonas_salina.1
MPPCSVRAAKTYLLRRCYGKSGTECAHVGTRGLELAYQRVPGVLGTAVGYTQPGPIAYSLSPAPVLHVAIGYRRSRGVRAWWFESEERDGAAGGPYVPGGVLGRYGDPSTLDPRP